MLWGGVSGVATVAVAAPIGMIAVLVIGVAKQDTDALGLAIFLPIGAAISSPFAFAVGAFVGMFVGLTDSLLVAVSAAIIRVRSPEADSL